MKWKPPTSMAPAAFAAWVSLAAAAATIAALADRPSAQVSSSRLAAYAISGARIVTMAGPVIEQGVVVVRNGLIASVSAGTDVPPDASVIDGRGLSVYPGLIDMGTSVGLVPAGPAPPAADASRDEAERWKRTVLLQPHVEAARTINPRPTALNAFAGAGITSSLLVPPGLLVRGRSALVNVAMTEALQSVGTVLDVPADRQVVNPAVALHIAFPLRIAGETFPASLIGGIAMVRQALLDAQRYRRARTPGLPQDTADVALDGWLPALDGRLPVAIEANDAREIFFALSFAKEFGLRLIITGGREADRASAELKATGTPVVLDLDFPTRPRSLAPDADEPLRVIQARADAPRVASKLSEAGIPFAFRLESAERPADFLRNAARTVVAGLDAQACLRALTIDAARLAGAGGRLGSLEAGKIANLIVVDGDILSPKAVIRHVFVDGAPIQVPAAPAARPAGQ